MSKSIITLLLLAISGPLYCAAKLPVPDVVPASMNKTKRTSHQKLQAVNPRVVAASVTSKGEETTSKPEPKFTTIVYPGSLKSNIERIVKQSGWGKVAWELDYDYQWVGKVTLEGNDVSEILQRMLAEYPLQAIFYEGNHIVAIVPRYV